MYAIFLFLFIFVSLVSLLIKNSKRSGSSSAPGPVGWPIFGNLPQLGRKPHETLTALREKYGDVYQIQMGSYPTIVLNGWKTIKAALVKQGDDFSGRPDFYSFRFLAKGKSMGFCDFGARWRLHRKIAQNSLALCANRKYNPIEEAIVSEARFLVDNLLASNGRPVDPHNEIYLSVGNIICALCFGERYSRDDADFQQLVKNNAEFMAFVAAGNPVDIMPWMRHFTKSSFRKFLRILDTMDALCQKKQREHLATYDASNIRDITDALIKATTEIPDSDKIAVGLTDEHIMITLQELIGAGFDTISCTLHWSILYLITHPDWQERVHEELRARYGLTNDPNFADFSELPLTEATILEIMRHSCIFPFALPHSTTRDTTVNGHFVKENTLVFVNLWSLSREPEVFPDPEVFNPKRFLNDTCTQVDRSKADQVLPFGAGKRRCPGEGLAKIEIFLFLSVLLQRCRFSVVPGQAPPKVDSKYGLTLKPLDFQVIVSKREAF